LNRGYDCRRPALVSPQEGFPQMMPRSTQTSTQPRRRTPRRARAILAAVLAIGAGAAMPATALAASADNDSNVDARLVGYSRKVAIEKSSATPSFLLFFFLIVVGCIPLFKNAKRD
jgi:hypothetical protein